MRKSVVSTSGRERVVSSVTYETGSPALTATSIASALRFAMSATSHCSTNWRIGLDPMNAQTSMRSPVRWLISMIGVMSAEHGAAGAADPDVHLAIDDFLAEAEHVVEGALAAAGETDVRVLDLEIVHQVQDAQLVVDRRVLDARVLEAVAQRLVDELEALGREPSLSIEFVPIEDKAGALAGAFGLDIHGAHGFSIGHRAHRRFSPQSGTRARCRKFDAVSDRARGRRARARTPSAGADAERGRGRRTRAPNAGAERGRGRGRRARARCNPVRGPGERRPCIVHTE